MKLLHVCLPIFASILHFFGNSLHAAVFKSPKIQCEYLHSQCSPFVRNQFEGKKNVLTDTLALKSIDPDAYLVPSLGFNHSPKNICPFPFLHNRLDQSENEDYPLTHIVFL